MSASVTPTSYFDF